jgi:hypothetical protein
MIDPKLHDWWSRKHWTDLSVVGTAFAGAGVSLRVILHALGQKNLTWYSLVYGDFNDDILLLAVDDKIASSFKNSPYPQIGPMQQASDCRGGFTEYVLNGDIQSALGVSIDEKNFHIEHRELIQQQIYIHDDCFFEVEPVGGTELRELIQSILKQHSFYLSSDVHWDGIVDETAALLNMVQKVRIQSEPVRQRLTLSWNDRRRSLLQRVLGLRSSRHIEIQDGKAKYSD